jgi:tyrosinase
LSRAADTWRLPFWDWAAKKPTWNVDKPDSPDNLKAGLRPNVPFVVTQKDIEVRVRGGTSTKVPNPMYQFALKEGQAFSQYGVNSTRRTWVKAA